jgi:DNA-binding beta-propeller fold protein YncE
VWVANGDGAPLEEGGLVTELNASTGALVKVITGTAYAFESPTGISSDGKDVWVTNYSDGSVTGFPA